MYRFYRAIKTALVNTFSWGRDYVYAVYWQVHGLFKRYDAAEYIEAPNLKGTIILIPGVYERWQFMKPIVDTLHAHGYSVHVIEGLGYNTGTVEEMAERVQEYVRTQQLQHYSIVAHSKGGLIAKYLLGTDGRAIDRVVTINTPFGGSVYAKLFPFKSIRLFVPTSALILLLAKDLESNQKITSIYSTFDPHIPGGSFLEGATNIELQTRGHFRLIKDARLHATLLRSLDEVKNNLV